MQIQCHHCGNELALGGHLRPGVITQLSMILDVAWCNGLCYAKDKTRHAA